MAINSYPLKIFFGAEGDYKLWSGHGWHADSSDANHTWMAHVAEIRVPLARVREVLWVSIDLIPKNDDQDVICYLNGAFIGFWRVSKPSVVSAHISAWQIRPGENSLTIVCPRAVRPEDGDGRDERTLGIAVKNIELSERI